MMNEITLLIGCIAFYVLGRLSHREHESLSTIKQKIKRLKSAVKPGPIDYLTPEQAAYYGSEEEAADTDRVRAAREAGLIEDDDL